MKKILIIIFIFIFSFELYLRIKSPVIHKADEELGWILKSNLNLNIKQKDFMGHEYDVEFLTNQNSSRFYGDIKNANLKILVLGDSFTNMPYASNDKMWFSIFADKIENQTKKNIYIETLGAGGYGNFQQLLLLERYYKDIDPDLIIIQMCNNDFVDNTIEWQIKNYNRNQYTRRPHLKENKKYYYEGVLSMFYNSVFFENIRILNRIDLFITVFQNKLNYIINKKSSTDVDMEIKKNSVIITNKIFEKVTYILKDKKVFIFNCSDDANYPFNHWEKIALKNKMIPINVFESFKYSDDIFYKDGRHFNEIGNKQVGEILAEKISKIHNF